VATSLAHAATWRGEDVALSDVERALANLRCEHLHEDEGPDLRTSVLTHLAWVPPVWREAAEAVLEGLGERHPSRTIVLFPDPESERDAIDAEVAVEGFEVPGLERHVATEVVRLWLRNGRVLAPASIVLPLLIPDLPVFLRWRGEPPFSDEPFVQLADVADRLVIDSGEWDDLERAAGQLVEAFELVIVSDIAWARTARWRAGIARLWPAIADARVLRVEGPHAESLLLHGWLRARLKRDLELDHAQAEDLVAVALDDEPVEPEAPEPKSPSDLLSDQLEIFGRDRAYEEAIRALEHM
jgi:glucose-6-phosphate dehydrogenase assembly protein OpcA